VSSFSQDPTEVGWNPKGPQEAYRLLFHPPADVFIHVEAMELVVYASTREQIEGLRESLLSFAEVQTARRPAFTLIGMHKGGPRIPAGLGGSQHRARTCDPEPQKNPIEEPPETAIESDYQKTHLAADADHQHENWGNVANGRHFAEAVLSADAR
jgi:hypothetical protein